MFQFDIEKLPDSFIASLADMDPIVGILSKTLRKSCGSKRIDAWKFVNSPVRAELAISYVAGHIMFKIKDRSVAYNIQSQNIDPKKVYIASYANKGISAMIRAKAVSGDPEFVHLLQNNCDENSDSEAVEWASEFDIPRILAPCFARIARISELDFFDTVQEHGSTRVLTWFLEERPDVLKIALPEFHGMHEKTVKWCVENLRKSSPGPVNWALIKANAILTDDKVSQALLHWVVIPPCPRMGASLCACVKCYMDEEMPWNE